MMDLKEKIKRDLKILSLEKQESIAIDFTIEKKSKEIQSIKGKIKRIPILGGILWYFYSLIKAPFRIKELYTERQYLYDEINHLKNMFNEINKSLDFLKNDFSFRYTKPEEFKILNLKGFIRKELKDSSHDFYALFENVFRGEDIKEKVSKYLPFLKEVFYKADGDSAFLDFGCGRGEFMRVLKDNEIPVMGVEINSEYAETLKKEGFNVHYGDGIEYLRSLPDDSLIGLSAIHVIEHLEYERQREFIELSYRKIKNDGLLIVETPNPKCSVALANFYIDFTHLRPCPYEFLCFLFEYSGFKDIKLILSSPVERSFRTGNPIGDYMDYAILGFKRQYENTNF